MANTDRQEILKISDVERVAELSRLKLDDEELERTAAQLERVLEYFTRLSAVDTDNIEPSDDPNDFAGHLREDAAAPGLEREQLIGLTKHNKDGFLTVPRAVE
ncbi:MAG: Asp-tRNA(Asn)/Glu-tRNA(Gln) amidotransferase subunit GatC [Clostridiaceae bacterium]|nr:Asp-tRNA(Asn)/Glu-tRNA(Gln) amidotransferase subunit GatC [Clostridiaceae bacterium]